MINEIYIPNFENIDKKVLIHPNFTEQLTKYNCIAESSSNIENVLTAARKQDTVGVDVNYKDISRQLITNRKSIDNLNSNLEYLLNNVEHTLQESKESIEKFEVGKHAHNVAEEIFEYSNELRYAYNKIYTKLKILEDIQTLQEIEIQIYEPVKSSDTLRHDNS